MACMKIHKHLQQTGHRTATNTVQGRIKPYQTEHTRVMCAREKMEMEKEDQRKSVNKSQGAASSQSWYSIISEMGLTQPSTSKVL